MASRRTLESALAGATLTGPSSPIDYRPVAVMPDVKVVKIGGQSVLDRGRAALFPILDEIIEARRLGVQVVVLAGGGTRARHIYSIASELEVPTGVVATLGKYIPMQNARMLQMLLANAGHTVSSDRLLLHVWGHRSSGDRQLLKQLVHRVRQKLEKDPAVPQLLQTSAGAGYKLVVE